MYIYLYPVECYLKTFNLCMHSTSIKSKEYSTREKMLIEESKNSGIKNTRSLDCMLISLPFAMDIRPLKCPRVLHFLSVTIGQTCHLDSRYDTLVTSIFMDNVYTNILHRERLHTLTFNRIQIVLSCFVGESLHNVRCL